MFRRQGSSQVPQVVDRPGLQSGGEDWHAGSPEQALSSKLSGRPVWTARRCGVSLAEPATGPDLPERVELVRAACPMATAPGSSRNWTRR
jgi:hypothetical protein